MGKRCTCKFCHYWSLSKNWDKNGRNHASLKCMVTVSLMSQISCSYFFAQIKAVQYSLFEAFWPLNTLVNIGSVYVGFRCTLIHVPYLFGYKKGFSPV